MLTKNMKTVSLLASILLLSLITVVLYASFNGDFLGEFGTIIGMPWGLVTIVDLYIGFVLLIMWVYWRERALLTTIIIGVFMMTLGNIIACLYLLYAVYDSQGSMMKLVNGKRVA